MVHIDGSYDGGLRCRLRHEPSGAELVTDAPSDNQGLGRSFSPTDLTGASLASCMMTTMAIVAERQGIDLSGATFGVDKHMTPGPPRRIAKLAVHFRMPSHVAVEHRQRLQQAASACPVHHALGPEVECEVRFSWEGDEP